MLAIAQIKSHLPIFVEPPLSLRMDAYQDLNPSIVTLWRQWRQRNPTKHVCRAADKRRLSEAETYDGYHDRRDHEDFPMAWHPRIVKTCAEVDISLQITSFDQSTRELAELLRLIQLTITECGPDVYNNLFFSSPCTLHRCAFCDERDRTLVIRLSCEWIKKRSDVFREAALYRDAIFSWNEDDASTEYRALRSSLRDHAERVEEVPKVPSRLHVFVGLTVCRWSSKKIVSDDRLGNLEGFIATAKQPLSQRIARIVEIRARTQAWIPSVDWWPMLRALVRSGIPVHIGDRQDAALWSRYGTTKDGSWEWLVGNGGDVNECYTSGYLRALDFIYKERPTARAMSEQDWPRFCDMLKHPSVRKNLRFLTVEEWGWYQPVRKLTASRWEAFGQALFSSASPLHLEQAELCGACFDHVKRGRDFNRASETSLCNPDVHVRELIITGGIEESNLSHLIELFGTSLERLELTPRIDCEMLRQVLAGCPKLKHLKADINLNIQKSPLANGTSVVAALDTVDIVISHPCGGYGTRKSISSGMIRGILKILGARVTTLRLKADCDAKQRKVFDGSITEAILMYFPNLKSLTLGNGMTDSFLNTLVGAYERESNPCKISALTIPEAIFWISSSPLLANLRDPRKRINQHLRKLVLNMCAESFEPSEDTIRDAWTSLLHLAETNRTLTHVETNGWPIGDWRDEIDSNHEFKHTGEICDRLRDGCFGSLTDVRALTSMRTRCAIISVFAFHRFEVPNDVMGSIFNFLGRQVARRIHSHEFLRNEHVRGSWRSKRMHRGILGGYLNAVTDHDPRKRIREL